MAQQLAKGQHILIDEAQQLQISPLTLCCLVDIPPPFIPWETAHGTAHLVLLGGSSFCLYLRCNNLSLLLLPARRLLLHPDQLRVPLPVLFVLVRRTRPSQHIRYLSSDSRA